MSSDEKHSSILKKPQSADAFSRHASHQASGRNEMLRERNSIGSGGAASGSQMNLSNMFPGNSEMLKLTQKDRQFEFYLHSAQKAIDIMRN